MQFLNSIPTSEDACEAATVLIFKRGVEQFIKDGDLARTLPYCDGLEEVYLSGIPDLTDPTLICLIDTSNDLKILDVSGCNQLSDVGVSHIAINGTQLNTIRLNSVTGITDPTISVIVQSLPHLQELEVSGLSLLTASSLRDIWSYGRRLRVLRLDNCHSLTDNGFPYPLPDPDSQPYGTARTRSAQRGHTLRHMPKTTLSSAPLNDPGPPPLLLPKQHILRDLETLDLSGCVKLTDIAIEGVMLHAPYLREIFISRCSLITDRGVASLNRLGRRLDAVSLAHLRNITDKAIHILLQACTSLRKIDISYCVQLTDLTIHELASLTNLRHLVLAGLPEVQHLGLSTLAEQSAKLQKLQIAECKGNTIDLTVIRRFLKNPNLEYLDASGVPAMKRIGIERFSNKSPAGYKPLYRVFVKDNITKLREFLDKEDRRRQEAELKNIPFIPRADDNAHNRIQRVPLNANRILKQCAALKATPGPQSDTTFRRTRGVSDRFEAGTRSTLIKDARIWTGARNGTETVAGDVLLSGGVIKGIGYIPRRLLEDLTDLDTIDAKGGWVTPGLGMWLYTQEGRYS
ncbi:hypothetical protein EIP86_003919 [Pleurotus ostreatoroseus]|nr:hypothetical protein EIP86_003919 [Pleurotus ostreatoroseus]